MEFNSRYHLGAVNSINWARILAQTVYYFSAYFQVQHDVPYDVLEPKIQFAVPTGNFGDILAGYYAKHLGLPIDKLVIATNANDILARFWKTGRYEKADSGEPEEYSDDEDSQDPTGLPHHHHRYPSLTDDEAFAQEQQSRQQSRERPQQQQAQTLLANGSSDGKQATNGAKSAGGSVAETLSPAMDILVSSNFERLLFYLALEGTTAGAVAADGEVDGGQAARVRMAAENVKVWMDKLKTEHRFKVPRACLAAARRDFIADRASDEEVRLVVLDALSSLARGSRGDSDSGNESEQTTKTIQKYFTKKDQFGSYVADPHTAVGLSVANHVAKTKCVLGYFLARENHLHRLTSIERRKQLAERDPDRARDCAPGQVRRGRVRGAHGGTGVRLQARRAPERVLGPPRQAAPRARLQERSRGGQEDCQGASRAISRRHRARPRRERCERLRGGFRAQD